METRVRTPLGLPPLTCPNPDYVGVRRGLDGPRSPRGWVWAIANIAHYSGTEWDASGQSAVLWIVIVIFLPVLGLILYLTVARPRLKSSVLR